MKGGILINRNNNSNNCNNNPPANNDDDFNNVLCVAPGRSWLDDMTIRPNANFLIQ